MNTQLAVLDAMTSARMAAQKTRGHAKQVAQAIQTSPDAILTALDELDTAYTTLPSKGTRLERTLDAISLIEHTRKQVTLWSRMIESGKRQSEATIVLDIQSSLVHLGKRLPRKVEATEGVDIDRVQARVAVIAQVLGSMSQLRVQRHAERPDTKAAYEALAAALAANNVKSEQPKQLPATPDVPTVEKMAE